MVKMRQSPSPQEAPLTFRRVSPQALAHALDGLVFFLKELQSVGAPELHELAELLGGHAILTSRHIVTC